MIEYQLDSHQFDNHTHKSNHVLWSRILMILCDLN